jgi:hypothetical protein
MSCKGLNIMLASANIISTVRWKRMTITTIIRSYENRFNLDKIEPVNEN